MDTKQELMELIKLLVRLSQLFSKMKIPSDKKLPDLLERLTTEVEFLADVATQPNTPSESIKASRKNILHYLEEFDRAIRRIKREMTGLINHSQTVEENKVNFHTLSEIEHLGDAFSSLVQSFLACVQACYFQSLQTE